MMIRSSKLTKRATRLQLGYCSKQVKNQSYWGQTTQSRMPPACTDTGEKSDETLSLAASNLFFQDNEIQKDVHPRREKEDDNHSTIIEQIFVDFFTSYHNFRSPKVDRN